MPHCKYPDPADDVHLVRQWVHDNIHNEQYGGGDSKKVVLVGQSAGGSHIATHLCAKGDPERAMNAGDPLSPPLAGVAYLSAPFYFDHTKARRAQTLREYYGSDDPEQWKDKSPLHLLQTVPADSPVLQPAKLPTMIQISQYDP